MNTHLALVAAPESDFQINKLLPALFDEQSIWDEYCFSLENKTGLTAIKFQATFDRTRVRRFM